MKLPKKHQEELIKITRKVGWWQVGVRPNGVMLKDCRKARSVIVSFERHANKWWLHASIARPKMMPTYDDLTELKQTFIGKDRKAIMVLPAEAEHVNIHNYCLHLFACLGEDPLPDFTKGSGQI